MKKSLNCILITLIMCSLALPLVPVAQSQPQSVKVQNYTYYTDSIGYIVVVGEVQNQGPNIIDSILLTGTITGSDGAQIQGYAQVYARHLLPQQKAPFYMEFDPRTEQNTILTEITDVEINVFRAEPTAKYQYQDLQITNRQAYIGTNPGTQNSGTQAPTGDLGVFWVTGSIQNTGTQTAQNITIVGTFYNNKGEVVAVGLSGETTVIPNSIEPSTTATFKLGAYDLNQSIVPDDKKIATYDLLIQLIGPLLEGDAPVPVATATPPPISSFTPVPTGSDENPQTGTINGDSTPTWIYAVAAVIAIIAIAAAFLMLKRRSKPTKLNRHR